MQVCDKKLLEDKLKWVKFSSIAWTHDNKGFFYQVYGYIHLIVPLLHQMMSDARLDVFLGFKRWQLLLCLLDNLRIISPHILFSLDQMTE